MNKPRREQHLIALLCGINVGGNKKVPMAELRDLATGLGYRHVETYIQSGNLLFATDFGTAAVEVALEQAIEQRFGFSVEVIVRTAEQWRRYAAGSPFPDAEAARPNLLLLAASKRPLKPGAAEALRAAATSGERIEATTDAIWIDFPAGIGSSKLTPVVLDRAAGSTVTARNWRTVQRIVEMVRAAEQA